MKKNKIYFIPVSGFVPGFVPGFPGSRVPVFPGFPSGFPDFRVLQRGFSRLCAHECTKCPRDEWDASRLKTSQPGSTRREPGSGSSPGSSGFVGFATEMRRFDSDTLATLFRTFVSASRWSTMKPDAKRVKPDVPVLFPCCFPCCFPCSRVFFPFPIPVLFPVPGSRFPGSQPNPGSVSVGCLSTRNRTHE